MIQQHVASKIHDQRTAYIRYGMLFQEHGGKYDGHCQRYCAVADHWVFLEAFAGHERDAYRHGIVYVDAWFGVSMEYRYCTICVKTLSFAKVSGRKSCPLG